MWFGHHFERFFWLLQACRSYVIWPPVSVDLWMSLPRPQTDSCPNYFTSTSQRPSGILPVTCQDDAETCGEGLKGSRFGSLCLGPFHTESNFMHFCGKSLENNFLQTMWTLPFTTMCPIICIVLLQGAPRLMWMASKNRKLKTLPSCA